MLLLVIVLLLLFGGGGGYYGYSRWGSARGPRDRRNSPAHSPDCLLARRVTLTPSDRSETERYLEMPRRWTALSRDTQINRVKETIHEAKHQGQSQR